MDRLDELAIFVRIVEDGSLVRAARHLRRSAPAVTRALAALEDRVGQRLVERTTRRLQPSPAGLALLEKARALLAEYDTATSRTEQAEVRGLVRITAPVPFGRRHIVPIVMRFLDRYPSVQVDLRLDNRTIDLIDEQIDVALRIGAPRDSGLTMRKVGEVSRVWVASPGYIAAHGMPGSFADHETIQGGGTAGDDARADASRRGAPARPRMRFRVNDVETQIEAARAGRGIAYLFSYQVADDLTRGTLIRLAREREALPVPVQLVTTGKTHRAQVVTLFLDMAVADLTLLPIIRPGALDRLG